MDYLLNSSLSQNAPPQVSVSYDIACSYSVRANIRWSKYCYDTFANRKITWSIPMFHLNAHRERCRSVFSPYLLVYSGRLNGEGPERRWAMGNGYAPSTKEMGPGSRRDLLDDVFGDQNWAKVTKLRKYLELLYWMPSTLTPNQQRACCCRASKSPWSSAPSM